MALLGDAAHAMTPDLGQGGCQALEDAATLAALVGRDAADLPAKLAAYTSARLPRTSGIAARSRRAGRLCQAPPAVARGAARLMGMAPAGLGVRGLAPVLDWVPPVSR